MTLPILSASSAPPSAGAGSVASEPHEATASPSFSSVLSTQSRTAGGHAAEAASQESQAPSGRATHGRTQDTASRSDAQVTEPDDATASDSLAMAQAGLPAIALDIALQTAAVLERAQPSRAAQGGADNAPSRLLPGAHVPTGERANPAAATARDGNGAASLATSTVAGWQSAADTIRSKAAVAARSDIQRSDTPRQAADVEASRVLASTHADGTVRPAEITATPGIAARRTALQPGRELSSLADVRQVLRADTISARSVRPEASSIDTDFAARFATLPGGLSPDLRAGAAAGTTSVAHHSFEAITTEHGLAAFATNSTAPGGAGTPQTLAGAVALPLHHPQWPQAFGQQFVHLVQSGQHGPQVAELRLDPPDLGPLRISIQISDNVAHAVFVSAHANVRQTVENALPQLQEQLAQAGISLGQTSVNDQGAPGREFQPQAFARASSAASGENGTAQDTAASALPTQRAIAANALVDTFA